MDAKAPSVMLPDRLTLGDALALVILAALYAVMMFAIFWPRPLQRLVRRWL